MHTKEPWSVAEESFDNDGIHESVIRGLDGRAAIAVTLEFGENNPGMREANAHRIVACVNWCAGNDTEGMENAVSIGRPYTAERDSAIERELKLTKQRDELLVALKASLEYYRLQSQPKEAREVLKIMREAISKAEGLTP